MCLAGNQTRQDGCELHAKLHVKASALYNSLYAQAAAVAHSKQAAPVHSVAMVTRPEGEIMKYLAKRYYQPCFIFREQ